MNKTRKGFTLIELLVVMSVSLLVLGMIYTAYNSIRNGLAKRKAAAETEMYIDKVVRELTRTYGSARYVTISDTQTGALLIQTPGWRSVDRAHDAYGEKDGWMFTSNHTWERGAFNRGTGFSGDTYASGRADHGDILILLNFAFEIHYHNRVHPKIDYYRAFGINNVAGTQPTGKSTFVYVEYYPADGTYKVKPIAEKPSHMHIRRVEIEPDLLSDGGYNKKVLNISLGIRHYLHKVKELEDVAKAGDRYNYETQKYFTLYIRSR